MAACRRQIVALVVALTVGIAGWSGGDVHADVLPLDPQPEPPIRQVSGMIDLDWGIFATRVSRRYLVKQGDTMAGIAREHLGSAKRWKEILDANPRLEGDARNLRVGWVIFLPPREKAQEVVAQEKLRQAEPPRVVDARYEAFWATAGAWSRSRIFARAAPGPLPKEISQAGRIVLLRMHDVPRALEALGKAQRMRLDQGWFGHLVFELKCDSRVHESDPTRRVITHNRLGVDEYGRAVVRRSRSRFDLEGARVRERFPGMKDLRSLPAEEDEGPERWPKELGGLVAVLGLLLVGGVAARQRVGAIAS